MSTSEHTAHRTYSSRRPHWVTLMSTNRKLWLQFSQAHQKWCKGHESMLPLIKSSGWCWLGCTQSNRTSLWCDETEDSPPGCADDDSNFLKKFLFFYFLYHLVPPAFLKLKFWLSSIMFNSSLVNSFKSNLCYLKKKSQSKYLLSIKDIYNGSVCQRLVAWLTVDPWHGVNIPVQQRGTSPKQAFVVSFQFKHLRPV